MSRYIDADTIDYRNDKLHDVSDDFIKGIEYVNDCINNTPSIDIESKQGEWIVDEGGWKRLDYYPPKCKCNQCGYEEELYIIHAKPTNFCPNCGADMRKGADDEH